MVIQKDIDADAKETAYSKNGQFHGMRSFPESDPNNHANLETGKKGRQRGGWVTTPFIFGCEAAERLAMSGFHANLITFLVQQMHQKTLNAAGTLNTFAGVSMLTPLLGAFVADAYLGRFTTIALGSWIYLTGMLMLTMTALDKTLRPEPCTGAEVNAGTCQTASSLQMGMIYLSFGLMALGSGGIRPCVSPFGASQFNQAHHEESKQLKHYFNWYYFTVSVAALLATTVIVYIQDNVGWGLGFGIPSIVMFLSILFFFGGTWLYRYSPPQGSPFTRMVQVLVAAFRKRNLAAPDDPSTLYIGGTKDHCYLWNLEKSSRGVDDEADDEGDAKLNRGPDNVLLNDGAEKAKLSHGADHQKLNDGANELAKLTHVDLTAKGANHVHSNENVVQKEQMMMVVGSRRGGEDDDGVIVLRHSDQFRFLDKAAIIMEGDIDHGNNIGEGSKITSPPPLNPWRLCTVQQVEELKCIVRMVPMWLTVIPIALVISQQMTYTVQQARSMDRHVGNVFVVPPASMHTISIITLLLWLPFYDRKVIPILKRHTGNERGITFLQKIGVGFILLLLTMVVTTLVEQKRRAAARHFGLAYRPNDTIPISAFWLVPQFVLGGLSESFMMIGHMEFFYHLLPEHMTSTGSALFMTSLAVGSNLSSGVLHLVEDLTHRQGHPGWLDNNLNIAHLDYFYGFLTIVLFLDFVFYLLVAGWYKRQRNLMQVMVRSS